MAEPFLSEIRVLAFNYAPKGWATCDGQVLSIAENQALFSLLGTMYGGNGTSTFGLPNLNGRAPVGLGAGGTAGTITGAQGAVEGEATHALTNAELPVHTHAINASTAAANQAVPTGHILAAPPTAIYAADDPAQAQTLDSFSVVSAGDGAGHENRQPSLGLNFCIALTGIYPSRD